MSYRSSRHEPAREPGERIWPLRPAGDTEYEMTEDRGDWLIVSELCPTGGSAGGEVKDEERQGH